MEAIKVPKEKSLLQMEMTWNVNGTGICQVEAGYPDVEFLRKCLEAFAQRAGIDLQIRCSGSYGNQKEFMRLLADLFADVICTQCRLMTCYIGVGNARDGVNKDISCNLQLPGTVNWVYEVFVKEKTADTHNISAFFKELAEESQIQLKFHIPDYKEENNIRMFSLFGETLKLAFS